MTTKSQVTKTHNTKKDNSTQASIVVMILFFIMAGLLTACSSNGHVYMPSKASKKLTACTHIGCYAKK